MSEASAALDGCLQGRFDAHLAALELTPGLILLGVSGGSDSLALLDLVARSPTAAGHDLVVLHVDHGIHPESAAVAAAVAEAGGHYGLEVVIERLQLGPGTSETRARDARWAVFDRALETRRAAFLFTAHHADDQVETLLMRFLRGSGPAGLAGIPARSGRVVRPLLPFSRAELAEHAQGRGLSAWDDPSNADPRHDRGWIRTQVLPLLRGRWPDLTGNLLRGAELHRSDREAWNHLLLRSAELDLARGSDLVSVAAPPLQGYSSALAGAVVRALGRLAGVTLASGQVNRVVDLVVRGQAGRRLDVGRGWCAELSANRLRIYRPVAGTAGTIALLGPSGAARLGPWELVWRTEPAPRRVERTASVTWLVPGPHRIARAWRFGDRIRPLGGRGSRLVVRCMQDERVARGDRPGWPVVEADGEIVWVPDVCRSDSLVPEPGTDAVRIDAHRH